MDKTKYICQLSAPEQNRIRKILVRELDITELDIAMSGRLCDIEELL